MSAGASPGTSRWTAIVTVLLKPPRDADTLRKNPLGLYVDAIDWSRELETPADHAPGTAASAACRIRACRSGSPLDPRLSQPSQAQPENRP
jgi:hypothetical protein